MFRAVLYLIIGLFLITFLRMVIGVLSKGLGQLFEPTSTNPRTTGSQAPEGGELKRDPVCGTYVPAANCVQAMVNGKSLYFCSTQCRDTYKSEARA